MIKKILLIALAAIIIAAVGGWYYVFQYSKTHHRDVADEKGIAVAAKDIVKEYQTNETTANAKYLNKAVSVSGEVTSVSTDQAGNVTVTLKSDDTMTNVFCTLKPTADKPSVGSSITVKGICNGFLSDVVLNEAMIVK